MLRMIFQDLRISPGRSFLTGFSMIIGIISVIISVLAGTIGKDYLEATNEQLYGRSPTYSSEVQSDDFSEAAALSSLITAIDEKGINAAFTFHPKIQTRLVQNRSIDSPPSIADLVNGVAIDTIYTSASYAAVFNMPIVAGRWLTVSSQLPRLELVVNKVAAQNFPINTHAYLIAESTITRTPLEVIGIVNDGKSTPQVYINVEAVATLAPHLWDSASASLYWHDEEPRTNEQRAALIADLLHDYAPGKVENFSRYDTQAYEGVLQMISLSFVLVSVLLLGVAAIGLVNIGLASIVQRSHELLIRRALGATKGSVAALVIGSSLLLAVTVALVAILISFALVESVPSLLPADSPISKPEYPHSAAIAATAAAIATSLIGSVAPAIRATRLQPALALR